MKRISDHNDIISKDNAINNSHVEKVMRETVRLEKRVSIPSYLPRRVTLLKPSDIGSSKVNELKLQGTKFNLNS